MGKKAKKALWSENRIVEQKRKTTSTSFTRWDALSLLTKMVAIAVYWKSAWGNVAINISDDIGYVAENQLIRTWDMVGIFTQRAMGNYHPLTMLLYTAEYHAFGLDATGYHWVSLIVFIFTMSLIFRFLVKLGAHRRAVVAALVFMWAVNPMRVESVAWISDQKDLGATFFYLSSILMYLRYTTTASRWKYFWIFLTTLFFISACLFKPTAVTLPIIFIAIDVFQEEHLTWKVLAKNWFMKIVCLAISISAGIEAFIAQRKGAAFNEVNHSRFDHFMFICYGFMKYVTGFIYVHYLSLFHLYPLPAEGHYPSIYSFSIAFTLGFIALTFLIVWKTWKRQLNGYILFGIVWFIVTKLPTLQIQTIGHAIFSERYSYLPHIGLLITMYGIWKQYEVWLMRNIKLVMVTYSIVIVWHGYTTYTYAQLFGNSVAMCNHTLGEYADPAEMEGISEVYGSRGCAYSQKGRPDLAISDFTEAINTGAIKLNPLGIAKAYNDRGAVYCSVSQYDLGIRDFTKAIELNSNYAEAYNNLGLTYYKKGQYDLAIIYFAGAIKRNSNYAEAYNNLGLTCYKKGQYDLAIFYFAGAIKRNSNYAEAYNNLGLIYASENKFDWALYYFTKALQLNPRNIEAYNNRIKAIENLRRVSHPK